MKKLTAIILSLCIILSVSVFAFAKTSVPMPQIDKYGFVNANGIQLEYGIYSINNTEPLVLLPCNGADMNGFNDNVLPELAKHYKVICVSPRGTGKSGRGTGKLTFEVEADDLKILLDKLGIEKTYIFGFSDGGNLGLVFADRYPERVSKLAIMGSNINMFGTNPWDEIEIIINYIKYSLMALKTGDPKDALKRDIEGMMVCQPKLMFKDLLKIKIPVLNIYGENDMIMRLHSKLITLFIPDCKELMVKGGGHSSCFDQTDTVIMPALLDFFG